MGIGIAFPVLAQLNFSLLFLIYAFILSTKKSDPQSATCRIVHYKFIARYCYERIKSPRTATSQSRRFDATRPFTANQKIRNGEDQVHPALQDSRDPKTAQDHSRYRRTRQARLLRLETSYAWFSSACHEKRHPSSSTTRRKSSLP